MMFLLSAKRDRRSKLMKKVILILIVVMFVMMVSLEMIVAKNNKIVLKLGYGGVTTNPRHIISEKYANWVKKQTKGNVKIDLFPAEMLGTDKQMAEAVAMGTLDMSVSSQGVVANYEPKLNVIGLPFLVDSSEKVGKLLDGSIGKELAKDLPKKGMRIKDQDSGR
jgi:TRAP-type transport system periplasmic protein